MYTTLFRKPPGFTHVAGQFLTYEIDLPDSTPAERRRSFTIASAPVESDVFLTCRYLEPHSRFKEALIGLPPGSTVKATGPFGRFSLPQEAPIPVVFLAGGIGITSFRSIIVQAAAQGYAASICLLYSARSRSDFLFSEALSDAGKRLPMLRIERTSTGEGGGANDWQGRRGLIDAAFITQATAGLTEPIFYLCGPPGFVVAMEAALATLGVSKDRMKEEKFTGY